ncbi:ATP-binding protein [Novacetimonas hansenii]|uniref:histidine kinase n=3 Tax=Novacetimonas hansenii TaxID=436 RepID=D5QJ34_NOVHA|nr:integral membrane sensor signal transduction histidine kinase [Novacetimonas hansenii ATCC 23769]
MSWRRKSNGPDLLHGAAPPPLIHPDDIVPVPETPPGRMGRLHALLGRLRPPSLAARTSLLLICGLGVIQAGGLAIHALDRLDFDRRMLEEQYHTEVITLYRGIVETAMDHRDAELASLHMPPSFHAELTPGPEPDMIDGLMLSQHGERRMARMDSPWGGGPPEQAPGGGPAPPPGGAMEEGDDRHGGAPASRWRGHGGEGGDGGPQAFGGGRSPWGGPPWGMGPQWGGGPPLPPNLRPQQVMVSPSNREGRQRAIAFLLPDEHRWLTIHYTLRRPSIFRSPTFPIAFILMTVTGDILILWGVRRLIAPVGTLAAAAEALGRDVNAPPMAEDGPQEVARAAMAFNTMARRIRRFLSDRTLMLTAIGHDLRTPITRLKLRAEFIEDEDMQHRFLADLDELEAMVSATLSFGRDAEQREPMHALNLTILLQTILDEAAETHPDLADGIGFSADPPDVTIHARPVALKRALNNLVINAIKYGGNVRVTLFPPEPGDRHDPDEMVTRLWIEDDGPGLPPEDLERMFDPFVRAEDSRNRETGGTGLGLSISRNIIWGLGGDIRLGNCIPHGLRVTVTLVC